MNFPGSYHTDYTTTSQAVAKSRVVGACSCSLPTCSSLHCTMSLFSLWCRSALSIFRLAAVPGHILQLGCQPSLAAIALLGTGPALDLTVGQCTTSWKAPVVVLMGGGERGECTPLALSLAQPTSTFCSNKYVYYFVLCAPVVGVTTRSVCPNGQLTLITLAKAYIISRAHPYTLLKTSMPTMPVVWHQLASTMSITSRSAMHQCSANLLPSHCIACYAFLKHHDQRWTQNQQ